MLIRYSFVQATLPMPVEQREAPKRGAPTARAGGRCGVVREEEALEALGPAVSPP